MIALIVMKVLGKRIYIKIFSQPSVSDHGDNHTIAEQKNQSSGIIVKKNSLTTALFSDSFDLR